MAQTIEELQADRAAIVASRLRFLNGESVKEVGRAGRKLVMNAVSLKDFDDAIAAIDRDIAALTAAADGTRRRRAFTLSFG